MQYKVWHDQNTVGAHWFIDGALLPEDECSVVQIPAPGTAQYMEIPERFKRMIRLDKPDLIVTVEEDSRDIPIVSVEISSTTPQSQHAKQRLSRLAAAAEADFPAIYVLPGRKKSGGSYYSLGKDLYLCVNRMREINGVPVFIYRYPDQDGVLVSDPRFPNQPILQDKEIGDAFRTIREIMRHKLGRGETHDVLENPWIKEEIKRHEQVAAEAKVRLDNYLTLKEIDTCQLQPYLEDNTHMSSTRIRETIALLPHRILAREKTLFFRPSGRMLQHGGDPYCGMLSFFDYVFCRTGRWVEERSRNLAYMPLGAGVSSIMDEFCSTGYHRFWQDRCPFAVDRVPTVAEQFQISHHLQYGCVFTKMKPLRIFGDLSDMIVFQDCVLVS